MASVCSELLPQVHPNFKAEICHDCAVLKIALHQVCVDIITCRVLFKNLNIFPLYSQYILPLLCFLFKNIEEFSMNSEVHTINT